MTLKECVSLAGKNTYLGRNMKLWHDEKTRNEYWKIMDSILYYMRAKYAMVYILAIVLPVNGAG